MGFTSGSEGDKNFALFQAQLLGGPPRYDPVEEHMQWFMWTTGTWIGVQVVIGGAALWFANPAVAIGVIAVVTLGALALGRMVARRQRARSSEG